MAVATPTNRAKGVRCTAPCCPASQKPSAMPRASGAMMEPIATLTVARPLDKTSLRSSS